MPSCVLVAVVGISSATEATSGQFPQEGGKVGLFAEVSQAPTTKMATPRELQRQISDFDFCLSTSILVLTTSTYVAAWPQGDQFLGGGL